MPSGVGLALVDRVSPLYLPAIEICTLQCNFYIARMPQRTKAFPQKAKQAIREVRILAFLSRCAYQLDVCAKPQARLLNHAVEFRDAVSGDFRLGDHGRILESNVSKRCGFGGHHAILLPDGIFEPADPAYASPGNSRYPARLLL